MKMNLESTIKNFKRTAGLVKELYLKPLVPNLEGKAARNSLFLAGALTLSGVISEIANAYTLTMHANNLQGNNLPGVSITVNGSTQTTDANGNATFTGVTNNTDVKAKKSGYIGLQQTINVVSDTTFNVVPLDTVYVRNGRNGTGTDTTRIRADEMQSVYGFNEFPNRKNPILRNATNWPNLQVPVQISGLSAPDSTNISNWIAQRNDYSGADIYSNGHVVNPDVDEGILIQPQATGYNTYNKDSLGNTYGSACFVQASNPGEIFTLKEFGYRAMTSSSGNTIIYDPSNYLGSPNSITTPKDEAYLAIPYILKKLKGEGKNDADLRAYQDSLTVNGVAGNPTSTMPYPYHSMSLSNYPNPAGSFTNIRFNLPSNGKAVVGLYNITGQKLDEKVIDGKSGPNVIKMDLYDYSSGTYMYRVQYGPTSATGRIAHVNN